MATATSSPRRPITITERGQAVLLALLFVLTVGAWALTIYQARTMDMPMGVVVRGGADTAPAAEDEMDGMAGMAGMEMDEPAAEEMGQVAASGMAGMAETDWSWNGFASFLLAWAVMMAAMMFPAAAPMLLLFHRMSAQRVGSGRVLPTALFAAGYLLVWSAVGAATWVLVRLASDLASELSDADRRTWAPLALGAVLLIAGLYQFTPLKGVCLKQCQSPIGFVMTRWRNGLRGALHMGLVHGAYCLGCCWALFAVLVAAGVMSLAWMLLLTLVVFAEKVLPLGRRGPQAVGVAFLVLAVVVAAGASDLPWTA